MTAIESIAPLTAEKADAKDLILITNNKITSIPWDEWAADIVTKGYAIVTITPLMTTNFLRMQELIGTVTPDQKDQFSFVDKTDGFYPVGYSYLKSVSNTDLCETFNFWKRYSDSHQDFEFSRHPFYACAARYETHASYYGQKLVDAIAKHYSYEHTIDIEDYSYLQFNHYREDLRRAGNKYLQRKHEDGHLLTLIKPNGPGLVVYVGGEECLVELGRDQAIVISGSLLTHLSEGEIEPTYHAVVNFTLPAARCSAVFNINTFKDNLPGFKTGKSVSLFEPANYQHMQFGHNPLNL